MHHGAGVQHLISNGNGFPAFPGLLTTLPISRFHSKTSFFSLFSQLGVENNPLLVLAAASFPAEYAWTGPELLQRMRTMGRRGLKQGERAAQEAWVSALRPVDGSPYLSFRWRWWCLALLLYLAGDGWRWNRRSSAAWSQSACWFQTLDPGPQLWSWKCCCQIRHKSRSGHKGRTPTPPIPLACKWTRMLQLHPAIASGRSSLLN